MIDGLGVLDFERNYSKTEALTLHQLDTHIFLFRLSGSKAKIEIQKLYVLHSRLVETKDQICSTSSTCIYRALQKLIATSRAMSSSRNRPTSLCSTNLYNFLSDGVVSRRNMSCRRNKRISTCQTGSENVLCTERGLGKHYEPPKRLKLSAAFLSIREGLVA